MGVLVGGLNQGVRRGAAVEVAAFVFLTEFCFLLALVEHSLTVDGVALGGGELVGFG
jgi:hypothetical protein